MCSLPIAGELVTTVSFLRSLVVNKTKTKIVFKPQASYRRGKRRQVFNELVSANPEAFDYQRQLHLTEGLSTGVR